MKFCENLISSTRYSCPKVSLLQIILEGVKVYDFLQHFKGNFKGRCYDSAVLPVSIFPNSPCCRQFCDFIDSTVLDWISQGVTKVHDVVGACFPPHLVLPLTVEPTDERFLNLRTRHLPFKLDHLPDLPHYVLAWHSRQRLMIRMDISTSKFTKIPKNSSVFPGGVIISPFVPYLLDGKQALFYITTLALLSPPLCILWVYLYHSISMIDMWVSYSHLA